MMTINEIIVKKLETNEDKIPFDDWYLSIKDVRAKQIIASRITRLKTGNFGDCKSVGNGVFELWIHYGSGLRIYFGRCQNIVIILLLGGDKNAQNKDIQKSINLWEEYKNEIERYFRDI